MELNMTFEESNQHIDIAFSEVQKASDGGFESGYESGYEKGHEEGYEECNVEKRVIIDNLQGQVDEKQNIIHDLQSQVDEKQGEIAILQAEVADKTQQIENLQNQAEANEQAIKILNEEIAELQGQITELQEQIAHKQEEIDSLEQQKQSLMEEKNAMEEDISNAIELANATTGKEDTDLTTAVGALVEGYSSEDYYDTFWDSYQESGERTDYSFAFAGSWWVGKLKPKYPLIFKTVNRTFYYSKIEDLKGCLYESGITELDFSQCTKVDYPFQYSSIKALPKIILGKSTESRYIFANMSELETIDEIYFGNNHQTTFTQCTSLRECNVSGVITKNISLQHSPNITTEDAINTIQHLTDYSTDSTNQYAYTITFHADVWTRLTELGNASPNGNLWEEYIYDLGWNFA